MCREYRELFPATDFKENRQLATATCVTAICIGFLSDSGHARTVLHAGMTNPRWRGKRSRNSRHMRNPQLFRIWQKAHRFTDIKNKKEKRIISARLRQLSLYRAQPSNHHRRKYTCKASVMPWTQTRRLTASPHPTSKLWGAIVGTLGRLIVN